MTLWTCPTCGRLYDRQCGCTFCGTQTECAHLGPGDLEVGVLVKHHDDRRCSHCGKTLAQCYDSPHYKGRWGCCDDCTHPTRERVAQQAAKKALRQQALEKLTDEERRALGVKADES